MLALLSVAYPNFELKDGTIQVYGRLLADIPGAVLEQAAIQITRTSKWFPSVAELVEASTGLMVEIQALPSEFEAWEEVYRMMQTKGWYPRTDINDRSGTPEFSHPLITRAVEVMGWKDLCMSEELNYTRPQFYKVYNSLKSRAMEDLKTLPETRRFSHDYRLQAEQPAETTKAMKILAGRLSRKEG